MHRMSEYMLPLSWINFKYREKSIVLLKSGSVAKGSPRMNFLKQSFGEGVRGSWRVF